MKTIIVNDQDKIIGCKERSKIDAQDIYRVSALWITNSKGDILLAQRALDKKNDPGKWGPAVAGTIEEGEDYDSNILKEAEEELGLRDLFIQKRDKIRRTGRHNYFCQWYTATIDKEADDFIIQKDEVEKVKWISPKNLLLELKINPEDYLENLDKYLEIFR